MVREGFLLGDDIIEFEYTRQNRKRRNAATPNRTGREAVFADQTDREKQLEIKIFSGTW